LTTNVKKIIAVNVATVAVLAAAGFGGYHFYDQSTNYIKTENAKIDGKQVIIPAPVSGKLTDWNGTLGKVIKQDGSIGHVASPSLEDPQEISSTNITAPTDLTIVSNKALSNSLVAQGTPLAYGYNFDELYVTANIDEADVQDVEVGQKVDLYVDALKNDTLKGKVEEIGLATASEFSVLPSGNSDGNYTKVKQVVPVKISITDAAGKDILPGMNVTVKIHK